MIDYSKHKISGLNTLIGVLRIGKEQDKDFKSFSWSSINEYPILFSLIPIYRPDNVVESGTCNGASALTFAVAMNLLGIPGNVFTWDIKPRPRVDEGSGFSHLIKRNFAPFSRCGDILKTISGKKLFFIDGDHEYGGCLGDVEAIKPFLNKNDVIVFHDWSHGPIRDAVNDATKDYNLTDTYVIPSKQQIKVIVW